MDCTENVVDSILNLDWSQKHVEMWLNVRMFVSLITSISCSREDFESCNKQFEELNHCLSKRNPKISRTPSSNEGKYIFHGDSSRCGALYSITKHIASLKSFRFNRKSFVAVNDFILCS